MVKRHKNDQKNVKERKIMREPARLQCLAVLRIEGRTVVHHHPSIRPSACTTCHLWSMETNLSTAVKYCNVIVTHRNVWYVAYQRQLNTKMMTQRVDKGPETIPLFRSRLLLSAFFHRCTPVAAATLGNSSQTTSLKR